MLKVDPQGMIMETKIYNIPFVANAQLMEKPCDWFTLAKF